MGAGTAACYRRPLRRAFGEVAGFRPLQLRDMRLEQRRPPLDHLAQTRVDERFRDERSSHVTREASDLGHVTVGESPVAALGGTHDEPTGGRRCETGLSASMRRPQAAVDGEQHLPHLDFVRHRVGKGAVRLGDRVDLRADNRSMHSAKRRTSIRFSSVVAGEG